ncbi:MAG: cell division protein ZapE, partial [Gammaproteobacteria bacterium]|nr:cell division protein ZapE [Gammaproteobacteria bacterium]
MSPLERYRADIEHGVLVTDSCQAETVVHLETLFQSLVDTPQERAGVLTWLRSKVSPAKSVPVVGLYLWGGVGRGKTFMVDMFYECLPFPEKKRTHFHRFMRKVHEELKCLRDRQDPLQIIGQRFASQYRLLCLDEFFVNDIGDAMILSGLLRSLHERGVTLAATSNVCPDDLYKNGLQRDRFLPAIEWLKSHNRVVHVDGSLDYRLQFLDNAQTYFTPLGAAAGLGLAYNFSNVATEPGRVGV